jgi:hypothetical protein
MSAFFVGASQSAVASYIGRKNRNEPSQEVFASQDYPPRHDATPLSHGLFDRRRQNRSAA